jgi:hypothetical protein
MVRMRRASWLPRADNEGMEVLVVVQDPSDYRSALDGWRHAASIIQELPPWVAVAIPQGETPDVPGTRWYTGAVPPDVLLRLDPPARVFIAAWLDRLGTKNRPPGGESWEARGYIEPA